MDATRDDRAPGGRLVYHQACLDGKLAELATEGAAAGATDMDGYNDWLMQRWSGKPPTDVLAEWRELNASSRSRMRELGPRASLPTILGPTELSVFTVHVASEYGTHADDMGIEIPAAEQDTRRDWRLRLSRTVLEESGKGVEIDVDGDSISVGFGDESVVLSTDDFIAAVTARLPEGRLPEALGPALRVLA